MIRVFDKEKALVVKIDEKDYDSKKHFHHATHEPLEITVKVEKKAK